MTTRFTLDPLTIEAGSLPGDAAPRFLRTDEGQPGQRRFLVYEDGPEGLRCVASGSTRAEASRTLRTIPVAWTAAGDSAGSRVRSRRDRFLVAFVEALFDEENPVPGISEIIDNAHRWVAKLPPAMRRQIETGLSVLEALLGGEFAALSIRERQAAITDELDNFGGLLKDLGRLRTIFYAAFFQDARSWEAIGFVPPQARECAPPLPVDISEIELSQIGERDSCDWLVVGSGAGGAAAAAALARNRHKVVVVERGDFWPAARLTHDDADQYARIYIGGGLQTTGDRDLAVLQARCVGGSSLINNCICFRPSDPGWTHPDAPDVIGRWERSLGIRFDRARLDEAYAYLERRLNVHRITEDQAGANGAHLLGAWRNYLAAHPADPADSRATSGYFKKNYGTGSGECWACGYCNSGCPYHLKNSVLQSLLVDAYRDRARVVANAEVTRINVSEVTRRAQSVDILVGGRRRTVTVRKGVVVAAGVGASSTLLQASGVRPRAGFKLSCNLACPVIARRPEKQNSWDGLQMATYVDRDSHLIESWFHPPATFCASMGGWFGEYRRRMSDYSRLVCFASLMPTHAEGKIADGRLMFSLKAAEIAKLRRYVGDLAELHFDGGADEVYLPTSANVTVHRRQDVRAAVRRTFRGADDFIISTAHPQGGNPIGRHGGDGAHGGTVDTNLQVFGWENVFVADASIFPTSIRVNPQLAIMAFAWSRFVNETP